jgi:hypothetical protein
MSNELSNFSVERMAAGGARLQIRVCGQRQLLVVTDDN